MNLNAVVPNYGDIITVVRRAKQHIEDTSHSHSTSRERMYGQLHTYVVDLREAHEKLMASMPDISADINRSNRTRLYTWVSIALVSISAVTGVFRLVLSWLGTGP